MDDEEHFDGKKQNKYQICAEDTILLQQHERSILSSCDGPTSARFLPGNILAAVEFRIKV